MRTTLSAAGIAGILMWAVACSRQPSIDAVAVGQDVAVTRTDGGLVEGKVTSVDKDAVRITSGPTSTWVAKDRIADVTVVDGGAPVILPPAAEFREYTVAEGTLLSLTLANSLSSDTSRVEDPVEATLVQPVSVRGVQVLPAGSVLKGVVSSVRSAGKVKGLGSIRVHFTRIAAAGRDDDYAIDASFAETADSTKKKDAVKIGIGAGAGAAIGGILGGKGGAATGAAIGGGAGTAAVLATKGDEIERPAGSRLTVSLKKSIDVRVPIGGQRELSQLAP